MSDNHHHNHRIACMNLPDPLSTPVSIDHRSRQVFQATLLIITELWWIGSTWSSNLCSSMWNGLQEYIAYELSLPLRQCPVCLVRLTWIVFVMGGSWWYSCCFVGCCLQGFSNTARKHSIIKGFWNIVFIFIAISTTFQPICPPGFFREA